MKAARMWNWEMAISFKNKSVFSFRASQGPLIFPVTRQSACRLSSDWFHRRFNWAKLHYVCKFPSANQCGLDITVCADWGLQAPGHILPTEGGREGGLRPGCYIPELQCTQREENLTGVGPGCMLWASQYRLRANRTWVVL